MKSFHPHIFKRIRNAIPDNIGKQTKWLLCYVRQYRIPIVVYTLLGLTGTAVSLISSIISKDLIDIITGHETGLLIQTFCLYIGFAIGNLVLTQLSGYVSTVISLKVDNEIKADIFDKMLVTDWESITSYHTGDLLTRWSSDASTISSGILNWIPNLIIYISKFIASLAIVIYYDPTFAVFALLGIPVSLGMSRTLLNRMQDNNRRSAAMNAKLSGFNQETFSNIQTIKAFDLIQVYKNHLKGLQQEYLSMRKDFQKLSIFTSIILSTAGLIVSYSCYGWGIYRVWSGSISYGTMTLFLSLSGMLTSTINSMISLIPAAISITTSAGRLIDIFDMPKEDDSHREEVLTFYEQNRKQGITVDIQGLDYTYHNGTSVFRCANFTANPHEIIALVGSSGEGKTTLLRILLSLLRPQSGTITLSSSSESLPLSPSARQLFAYVPQGNSMFSGTIFENMQSVQEDATEEEMVSCLKQVAAWDFVSALPKGIHSHIGERGSGFSEGQSQRLSIARALLRQSPILLLDEATSALDPATEETILNNIMQSTYPRTCIVTTHRPAVLKICRRVYSIQNGKCILLTQEEIDKRFSK